MELEAGRVASELAEVEQSLLSLKERVNRLEVYAPVDGIIQALAITRINAVVEPGKVIMQVVPVDDDMIVETRVSCRDRAYTYRTVNPGEGGQFRLRTVRRCSGKVRQILPRPISMRNAIPIIGRR